MAVEEYQKDVAFSQGMLEQWLKDAPQQIKEALKTLIEGVSYYKNMVYSEQEKTMDGTFKLSNSSNQLGNLLATVQHQQDQITELEAERDALANQLGLADKPVRRRANLGDIVEV